MNVILIYISLLLQLNSDRIFNIKIDPEKDKDTNFLLSEIAREVKYVKLETKDNCMISMIMKLLTDGDYVFISSHQGAVSRLFVFTDEGIFLNEIGSPGRGPGEFSTVLDFTASVNVWLKNNQPQHLRKDVLPRMLTILHYSGVRDFSKTKTTVRWRDLMPLKLSPEGSPTSRLQAVRR